MIFTIKTDKLVTEEALKRRWLAAARKKVILYKLGADEIALDNYLAKNYSITLKSLCLAIILNTKIVADKSGLLITQIKNPELERLARLITFGTGKVSGSKILKYAFEY